MNKIFDVIKAGLDSMGYKYDAKRRKEFFRVGNKIIIQIYHDTFDYITVTVLDINAPLQHLEQLFVVVNQFNKEQVYSRCVVDLEKAKIQCISTFIVNPATISEQIVCRFFKTAVFAANNFMDSMIEACHPGMTNTALGNASPESKDLQDEPKGKIDPSKIKRAVYNRIDFPLPDSTWEEINDAFGDCWNNVVGTFTPKMFLDYIDKRLREKKIFLSLEQLKRILWVMFDYIEMVGGVFDEPHNPNFELHDKIVQMPNSSAIAVEKSTNGDAEMEEKTTPPVDVSQAAGTSPAVKSSARETVYLSALLRERFPDTCARLVSLLGEHGIPCRFLEGTRDVWCRDYMPVQTASGKLVQFRYDPSYLRGKPEWEASRTDPAEVCRANGITPDRISDINLDGGNVLLCDGRAVISDRVFTENPDRDRQQLLTELSDLLEAEIILIPALKSDMTGHADGMVRFIDRTTLLGNDRALEYKYWSQGIDASLLQHAMRYEDVPFFYDYKDPKHPNHAIGVYVNYLAVGNLIVLPEFGVPGNKDAEALARIRALFPARTVVPFNCNDIALEGGLLNCITWTRRE